MSKTDPLFVRVSTPDGHFSVPTAIAARAGSDWSVLSQDAVDGKGRPLPAVPREELGSHRPAAQRAAKKAAARRKSPKLRGSEPAATPTKSEATASVDTEE